MKNIVLMAMVLSTVGVFTDYKMVGLVDQKYTKQRQKEKLFTLVGCKYFNNMIIDSTIAWNIDAHESPHYQSNKEYYDSLYTRYGRDVSSRALAPMYLKFISNIVGYGVFAAKNIKSGDFIGVYAGELRPMRDSKDLLPEDVDYAWYYLDDTPSGRRMIVDGKYMGNELRFINHDSNPNTGRIDVIVQNYWYICYVALRDIAKDEQLTISYGSEYWSSRSVQPSAV